MSRPRERRACGRLVGWRGSDGAVAGGGASGGPPLRLERVRMSTWLTWIARVYVRAVCRAACERRRRLPMQLAARPWDCALRRVRWNQSSTRASWCDSHLRQRGRCCRNMVLDHLAGGRTERTNGRARGAVGRVCVGGGAARGSRRERRRTAAHAQRTAPRDARRSLFCCVCCVSPQSALRDLAHVLRVAYVRVCSGRL